MHHHSSVLGERCRVSERPIPHRVRSRYRLYRAPDGIPHEILKGELLEVHSLETWSLRGNWFFATWTSL